MKVYTWRWLLCRYLQAICCDCTTRISNWGGSFDSSGGYIKCNIFGSLEDLVISIYLSFSNLFLHLFRFFPLYFQFRYTSFLLFLFDPHLPRLSIASDLRYLGLSHLMYYSHHKTCFSTLIILLS